MSSPACSPSSEWDLLSKGSIQRVRALNMFLEDLYHGAEIVRAAQNSGGTGLQ